MLHKELIYVVGNPTVDVLIHEDGKERKYYGGTAVYASMAARKLGAEVRILANGGRCVRAILRDAGVDVSHYREFRRYAKVTNIYSGVDKMMFAKNGKSITIDQFPEDIYCCDGVLIGPTLGEVDLAAANIAHGPLFVADLAGFLRQVCPQTGCVRLNVSDNLYEAIKAIHIVKCNREEAFALTGEPDPRRACVCLRDMTTNIAVVTVDFEGAYVCSEGEPRWIPAYPTHIVDPTGAGDVFAAALLVWFIYCQDIYESAFFACAAASFIVEGYGFQKLGNLQEVMDRMISLRSLAKSLYM